MVIGELRASKISYLTYKLGEIHKILMKFINFLLWNSTIKLLGGLKIF